ncbi:MAG: hypothetical protein KatS3mg051_0510 [Anaerolineae bacterium]|nr:MAG: hypothetical protein KatS3mg051_0510 [Anaerolineae bacterium]
MQVGEAIKTNRAVREFADRPVSREEIVQVVNAGRLAGSAKNRQPWTFVVVTARDTLRALTACGPWCAHVGRGGLSPWCWWWTICAIRRR